MKLNTKLTSKEKEDFIKELDLEDLRDAPGIFEYKGFEIEVHRDYVTGEVSGVSWLTAR